MEYSEYGPEASGPRNCFVHCEGHPGRLAVRFDLTFTSPKSLSPWLPVADPGWPQRSRARTRRPQLMSSDPGKSR
jgi:hypothetical protein